MSIRFTFLPAVVIGVAKHGRHLYIVVPFVGLCITWGK
jgi:hypothetical protein